MHVVHAFKCEALPHQCVPGRALGTAQHVLPRSQPPTFQRLFEQEWATLSFSPRQVAPLVQRDSDG